MLYSFDPLELAVGAFGEVLSSIDADPIFPLTSPVCTPEKPR